MSIISLLVYIPLQVLFIPIAIVGVILVAYKQMVVSKRLGLSQTAIEILNGRWTMHVFGMRDDQATAKLAAVLPNTSLFGLRLALFPLWVKYKISGKHSLYPRIPTPGSESIADFVIARTLYFDRVIERAMAEVDQFVILGAGYDMRAYGNLLREGVAVFELDQASVQQHKKSSLELAGISCEHVKFVSVDFEKESLFEKLIDAGYEPPKKTLFLWEGVTLYLSEADVRKTIQDVYRNSAAGSVLLADMYADRFLSRAKSGAGKKTLEFTDEEIDFSFYFSEGHEQALSNFVESESMSVGETFFLGSESEKGPFMVVVEMKRE